MSKYIVAITGASGSLYAAGLLRELLLADKKVVLLITEAAKLVLAQELQWQLPASAEEISSAVRLCVDVPDKGELVHYHINDISAPVASGSVKAEGMVVVPCSMGTMAHIAAGLSGNLLQRAADVILKEKRKLIIVPRETPFNIIHIKNMLSLAEAGAHILPAMPAYYHNPRSIEDLQDFLVGRILDTLGLQHSLYRPWGAI